MGLPRAEKSDERLFASSGGCVVLEYLGAMVALSAATTQRDETGTSNSYCVAHWAVSQIPYDYMFEWQASLRNKKKFKDTKKKILRS